MFALEGAGAGVGEGGVRFSVEDERDRVRGGEGELSIIDGVVERLSLARVRERRDIGKVAEECGTHEGEH